MKTMGKICVLSVLLLLLIGCSMKSSPAQKPQPQAQGNQVEKHVRVKPDLAREVKKTAEAVKGVDDSTAVVFNKEISVDESTAVVINKDISVVVKVSGFQRLRLQSIKEEVHKKIKAKNKDYKVHVTSDKKLFKQLQAIEKKINEGKAVSNIEERLNKINEDM